MPKFTELADGTVPIDYGSVMAVSTYDGVSAYTSEQFTMNELQQAFLENDNPNGRRMNASTAINEDIITDSDSSFVLYVGSTASYEYADLYLENANYRTSQYYDIDTPESSTNIQIKAFHPNGRWAGFAGTGLTRNVSNDAATLMYVDGQPSGISTGTLNAVVYSEENTNVYTMPSVDAYPVVISGRSSTVNAGVTNAVIAGGVGTTADKDDYLFTGKHELQLATETFSFEDSGSTGATEQDWIEVSVGGVTGYIRVFATK